jgi:hypothetical protein
MSLPVSCTHRSFINHPYFQLDLFLTEGSCYLGASKKSGLGLYYLRTPFRHNVQGPNIQISFTPFVKLELLQHENTTLQTVAVFLYPWSYAH